MSDAHQSTPPDQLRRIPQQDRGAKMLARIERAAIEVIEEFGRDAFTTTQVAQRAGCSVGALYRHFSDRLAILDWVYPDRPQSLGPVRPSVGQERQLIMVVATSPETIGH